MYAIGIDVSKGKSTIAINHNGILLEKPFEIKHTDEGLKTLTDKINDFKKGDIKFVMEATGIYHLPILLKLLELQYFVCVENAFLIKKYFLFYIHAPYYRSYFHTLIPILFPYSQVLLVMNYLKVSDLYFFLSFL